MIVAFVAGVVLTACGGYLIWQWFKKPLDPQSESSDLKLGAGLIFGFIFVVAGMSCLAVSAG